MRLGDTTNLSTVDPDVVAEAKALDDAAPAIALRAAQAMGKTRGSARAVLDALPLSKAMGM